MDSRLSFSRRITSVNYDPDTETLEIGFNTGSVYTYANVPASLFDALEKAKDPYLFFEQKIFGQFGLVNSV